MNYRKVIVASLFGATAALPLCFAQSSSSPAPTSARPTGGNIDVARTTADAVKDDFTAKDLLGKSVHDIAGEKLGTIEDISLAAVMPDRIAGNLNRDGAAAANMPGRATAYISVGGLFGIGNELVAVPVSALRHNAAEDRFELSVSKSDFVALAEQRVPAYTRMGSPAQDGRTTTTAAADTRAPRVAGDANAEATRIGAALRSDPTLSAIATSVQLKAEDDALVVSGTVQTRADKDRIVSFIREKTSMSVRDQLKVAAN